MESNNKKYLYGWRIAEARDGKYTQDQLAQELGVKRPVVAYWESGDRVPNALQIEQIAKLCHIPSDYLLGLTDSKAIDTAPRAICDYTGLSDDAVKVLHFIASPPDDVKDKTKAFNEKTLTMLNVLLTEEAKKIVGPPDECPLKNVFSDMYCYIHADETPLKYLGHDDGSIPEYYNNRDIFQDISMRNIRGQLDHLSQKKEDKKK